MTNKINGIDVSEYFIEVVDEGGSTIDYKILPNSERLLVEKIFEQNQQFKHLQEENEELKKRCEDWASDSIKLQAQIDSKDYQLNKYKEILKDIREIIEMPKYTCKEFLYIRGKINEVLNDRNKENIK